MSFFLKELRETLFFCKFSLPNIFSEIFTLLDAIDPFQESESPCVWRLLKTDLDEGKIADIRKQQQIQMRYFHECVLRAFCGW